MKRNDKKRSNKKRKICFSSGGSEIWKMLSPSLVHIPHTITNAVAEPLDNSLMIEWQLPRGTLRFFSTSSLDARKIPRKTTSWQEKIYRPFMSCVVAHYHDYAPEVPVVLHSGNTYQDLTTWYRSEEQAYVKFTKILNKKISKYIEPEI